MTGTDLCVNKCKQFRSYLNHLVYKKRSLESSETPVLIYRTHGA